MRGAGCFNISWQGASFYDNTAGADGGAMFIAEMIYRNISGQAVFSNNTVRTEGWQPLLLICF